MGNFKSSLKTTDFQIIGKNQNERFKDYFKKLKKLSKYEYSIEDGNLHDFSYDRLMRHFVTEFPNENQILNASLEKIYSSFISFEESRINSFTKVEEWIHYFNNESKHIKKLTELFKNQKICDVHYKLPKILLNPYIIKFLTWFYKHKEKHKHSIFDSHPDEEEWSNFCEEKFSGNIQILVQIFHNMPLQIIDLIMKLIGFALNESSITQEEEYHEIMRCIFRSIPVSIPGIQDHFYQVNALPIQEKAEIFNEAIHLYISEMEKLDNDNKKLTLFSIFCLLLNVISLNNVKNGIYTPLRRKIAYKILKKLNNYEQDSVNFYTNSKLNIFEKVSGDFISKLKKQENISSMDKSLYNVDYYDLHNQDEICSFDLIKYIMMHKESNDIKSLLGRNPEKVIQGLTKFELIKISGKNSCKHVLICLSGFMSEDYEEKKMWIQLIEYFPNSQIYAVKYASSKGKKIMSLFQRKVFEVLINPKIKDKKIGIYAKGKDILVKEMNEALNQAELTGKALAACIKLRDPFKSECISLMGFSLGTVVLKYCIKYLYEFKAFNHVHDVYMLGGAASFTNEEKAEYSKYSSSIVGKIYNCFLESYWALKLFQTFYSGDPIGLQEQKFNFSEENLIKQIKKPKEFTNINLKGLIEEHWEYMPNLKNILWLIQNYKNSAKHEFPVFN